MSHASAGFGANHGVRDHLRIEDGTHEHAPAGILVGQVRRLGTIPPKVLEPAAVLPPCGNSQSPLHTFNEPTFKPIAIELPVGARWVLRRCMVRHSLRSDRS